MHHAGVVNQNIHAAMILDHLPRDFLCVLFTGKINPVSGDMVWIGSGKAVGRVPVNVPGDHKAAALDHALSQQTADAVARAGD